MFHLSILGNLFQMNTLHLDLTYIIIHIHHVFHFHNITMDEFDRKH